MSETTTKASRPRAFVKGEYWTRGHEDLRELIRACARRRKTTPHLLAVDSGISHSVGDFARETISAPKTLYVSSLITVLVFHRFLPLIVDPSHGGRYEVRSNDDLRAALRGVHEARGLSADAYRLGAGCSSSMATFIRGIAKNRSANVSSLALSQLLGHYGTPLVVQDLLHRSVMAGQGPPN